ncbi:MAG: arsenate reductase (glutaredoxin) [Lishizhenia sp.]
MKIYHNPRCSKSRQTLEIINKHNVDLEIVEYLKESVTEQELKSLIEKLGIPAEQLVRKGESAYKENFKGKVLSEQEWIKVMIQYPKLIERPIVVSNNKAVLGRPPENVFELLK